jgi:multidrug efflux pump subunit AcrA (membrane-fusion protein)
MEPTTIAMLVAAAMAAYGTHQQAQAQDETQQRQAQLYSAERMRQNDIDAQRSQAVAQQQLKLSRESQDKGQQSIAQQMEQYLTPQSRPAPINEYTPDNPGEPQEVKDRTDAAKADALAKGQSYASRLAQLSSMKMLNFNNATSMNRLGENVGILGTAAQRSAGMLPMELNFSPQAGRAAQLRGDLANGGSSIAFMYGLRNGQPAPTDSGGGTGITIPQDDGSGYTRMFGGDGGIDPKKAGVGLRAPRVPQLTFSGA